MNDELKVLYRETLPEEPLTRGAFPPWLHRKLPDSAEMLKTGVLLEKYRLNTVCEEAKCPNRPECYAKKTATFLALGKECTRNCGFCDIDFSKRPAMPEHDEPERIAASVEELGLKHVVITMVARDDLADYGASHIAAIVNAVRNRNRGTTIELLTSDFNGDFSALDQVLDTRPEIFNHNIETVHSLSPRVRHRANYERTLSVLRHAKQSGKTLYTKSGIMVGLGEKEEEVHATIRDLYEAGCSIITIGQYLRPSRTKLQVKEFIHPEQFAAFADFGHKLGVPHMYAGPFIRSSYNAALFAPKM